MAIENRPLLVEEWPKYLKSQRGKGGTKGFELVLASVVVSPELVRSTRLRRRSGSRPAFIGYQAMDSTFTRTIGGRDSFGIKHKIDVIPGQSGGPYFGWWADEPWPRVVSTQSAQQWGGSTGPNTCGGGNPLPELSTIRVRYRLNRIAPQEVEAFPTFPRCRPILRRPSRNTSRPHVRRGSTTTRPRMASLPDAAVVSTNLGFQQPNALLQSIATVWDQE